MSATPMAVPMTKPRPVAAILVGGFCAGLFDITVAFLRWGHPGFILRGIAGGLIGPRAYRQGVGTAVFGLVLHFFIALSAATVFYLASRKIKFLTQHAVRWGFFYGIAVFVFMYWVVLPLSRFPASLRSHSLATIVANVLTHMFCVGLPISLATKYYST
jgi:hypothetical protein